MRIAVDQGGYAFKNMGDLAMLMVGYARLRKLWPTAEIGVIADDCTPLERFLPGSTHLSCDSLRRLGGHWSLFGAAQDILPGSLRKPIKRLESHVRRAFPLASRRWALRRLSRRGMDVRSAGATLDFIEAADACVLTGGGYLTDLFCGANAPWCQLTMLEVATRLGKPVVLFGQGLGPFASGGVWETMKRVVGKIDLLCLREGLASLDFAKQLGIDPSRIVVTGDDAIEMVRAFASESLGDFIGINVRVAYYSGVDAKAREAITRFVGRFAKGRGLRYLPIPISFYENGHDAEDVTQILKEAEAPYKAFQDTPSPEAIIRQAGKCRLVVTGSYHAGVFALAQGVPVVGLALSPYYVGKFRGLERQFGNGCFTVEWGSDFEERLLNAAEKAHDKANEFRKALLRRAEDQMQASRQAWARLPIIFGKEAENCL